MKYRSEIDGLRAVAVLPVMLFHAGVGIFSGGFVGVDIFFVISGYLITTILINDLDKERFSLINFYERRARRILPALFIVMLFCLPFAWMWMLPSQMKDFSQSLTAVSLFISNFLFWKESGYFAAAAEAKPLLHTWSLAVEEQYYIFFPVFLLIAWRFGKNKVFWLIVIFSAISLAVSEWMGRTFPGANFYLAPSRAWELFAGSIAAFLLQGRAIRSHNPLSILGFAGIVAAIVLFDKTTPFPGLYALLPVIGTLLIIMFAGPNTVIAKLLSHRLLVGIGLISYSAYLWHQPLLAFARIRFEHPHLGVMLALCVVSIGLAYMSWKYIERPFRVKGDGAMGRTTIFIFSALGLGFFATIGLMGHRTQGFAMRLPSELQVQSNLSDPGSYPCPKDQILCVAGNQTSEKHMLLYGDSHANHIARALIEKFGEHYKITLVLGNSCFMGQDIQLWEGAEKPKICRKQNEYLDGLKGEFFDVVISSQYWAAEAYGLQGPDGLQGADGLEAAIKDRSQNKGIRTNQLVILGNNPENPQICLSKNKLYGGGGVCGAFEQERLFEDISRIYEGDHLTFIHPYKYLKLLTDESGPKTDFAKTYLDGHHLTKTGSVNVVDSIHALIP